jgi:hypothetical protein
MPLSKEAVMSRKIQFICLFVLLGLFSLATQPGFAQSPPLNFGNNFFRNRRLHRRRRIWDHYEVHDDQRGQLRCWDDHSA